jgi:hypothetical protein
LTHYDRLRPTVDNLRKMDMDWIREKIFGLKRREMSEPKRLAQVKKEKQRKFYAKQLQAMNRLQQSPLTAV